MTRPPVHAWTKDQAMTIKSAYATDIGRMAIDIIIEQLCAAGASSFSSDAALMAFLEGRRWPGIELSYVVTTPLERIIKETHEPRTGRILTATERAERAARSAG
jgi:hypothetical protein